jgi:ketosteroid isomerase-like protein
MSKDHNPVTEAMDAYAAAVYAKDLEAFITLYADGVHVFDSWGQWQYYGIDAWRAMAAGWFPSLGAERVEVGFDLVSSCVGDNVAFGSAAVTFSGISADGTRLRSMTNRITMGLEKKAGVWKIAHEHSSLPIDMATGKGIFTPSPA